MQDGAIYTNLRGGERVNSPVVVTKKIKYFCGEGEKAPMAHFKSIFPKGAKVIILMTLFARISRGFKTDLVA